MRNMTHQVNVFDFFSTGNHNTLKKIVILMITNNLNSYFIITMHKK